MNRILCTIVFVLFALLVSCTESEVYTNKHTLKEAAQLMESDPEQAATLLKSIDPDALSTSNYCYQSLLQVRVADLTDNNVTSSLAPAEEAMSFFTKHNDVEKSAFACFVVAKVYERQNNKTKALYYYMQADDWAKKANHSIEDFTYDAIPYNIALFLNQESKYEESLMYCKNSMEYLSDKPKYTSQLYTFELIGVNYRNLGNTDSALVYYNKALAIANTNNDSESKNRIAYNKCILFLNSKEYDVAKNECFKLLPLAVETEIVNKSVLYMVLSDIYTNTDKIDSASICLHKALQNSNSIETQIPLYKRLYELEQKKGNNSKASAFEKQYLQLKQDKSNARQSETEELKAEISRMKGQQLADYLAASHKSWLKAQERKQTMRTVWGFVVLASIVGFIFILRIKVSAGDGTWEAATIEGNDQKKSVFLEKTRYDHLIKLCCRMDNMADINLELKCQDFFSSALLESSLNPHIDSVSLGGYLVDIWERKNMRKTLDKSHELKNELQEMVHDMLPKTYWLIEYQLYNSYYKEVIYNINHKFSWLNNVEKAVLCLLSIRLFAKSEMANLLDRTENELTELEKILEQRFVENQKDLKQHLLEIYQANNFKPVRPQRIFLYAYIQQKTTHFYNAIKAGLAGYR